MDLLFVKKVELVTSAIKDFIKIYQFNPGDFFYEEEIRSTLFMILRDKFNAEKIYVGLLNDPWYNKFSKPINPVRAEYGNDSDYYSNYNIKNIDIVILSDELLSTNNQNNYQRSVDIVIELKFRTENTDSKQPGFINDVQKIRKMRIGSDYLGLAICFDLNSLNNKYEKFFSDYIAKGVTFKEVELSQLSIQRNGFYAIYITPESVFLSEKLESTYNKNNN